MDLTHPRWSMRSLTQAVVGCLLAVSLLLAPGGASPAAALVVPSPGPGSAGVADPNGVTLSLKRAAGGFDQPVLVQTAADGVARLFVVERSGRIMIYSGGSVRSKPYLDIRGRVNSAGGEQGLLGLVFSPSFASDRRLWVSYTDASGALRVSRFTAASAAASTVRPSTEAKVLRVPHPTYTNHNAGMLTFGLGRGLFISTGDGGGGGDPFNNAQDRSSLSGKILRINPFRSCNGRNFCVPKSNPYAAPGGALGSIWLYGVRNPWRFSVDRKTGDLWVADVGQDAYEEVTRVPNGIGGWNLGWSCREARRVYDARRCSSARTYHDPTIAYSHAVGESVIGGYVYRGSAASALLGGLYVFGDFVSGNLWVHGRGKSVRVGNAGDNRLSSFGQDGAGELWATTLDGGLYRLVATAR